MNQTTQFDRILLNQFKNQVLTGKLSNKDLMVMVENNSLSPEQLQVVVEMAPLVGGSVGGQNGAGQAAQNSLATTQKVQLPTNKTQQLRPPANLNPQNLLKQWNGMQPIVTKLQMDLRKLAQFAPQNSEIANSTASIERWFSYLDGQIKQASQVPNKPNLQ